MNITLIPQDGSGYPSALRKYLSTQVPETLAALGNLNILRHKTLALFCSVKCPGNLILQTYDLAQNVRAAGVTVIGGFHSPMESECLTILLRGFNPIIICPARGVENMRIPSEYQKPLADGRLLILSPFAEKQRRATTQTALYRNRVVAALADHIFVAHAEPSSKTEQFCRDVLTWRKPLYTLASDANSALIAMGARPITPNSESMISRIFA